MGKAKVKNDHIFQKEYKYFNYPNELTALEQFYYYLLELGAIPEKLFPEKMVEVFDRVAEDYVLGFIEYDAFSTMVAHIYYTIGDIDGMNKYNNEISALMDMVSDDWQNYSREVKKYLKDKKNYKFKP